MVELYKHQWPGNGRELRNYLERCVALQQYVAPTLLTQADQEIDENPIDVNVPLKELRERWVEKFEKQYLVEVLRAHGNNVTRAAAAAGMNRAHFHRLLARHGLRGS
jgi:DNA-binding NtrC family response regulator